MRTHAIPLLLCALLALSALALLPNAAASPPPQPTGCHGGQYGAGTLAATCDPLSGITNWHIALDATSHTDHTGYLSTTDCGADGNGHGNPPDCEFSNTVWPLHARIWATNADGDSVDSDDFTVRAAAQGQPTSCAQTSATVSTVTFSCDWSAVSGDSIWFSHTHASADCSGALVHQDTGFYHGSQVATSLSASTTYSALVVPRSSGTLGGDGTASACFLISTAPPADALAGVSATTTANSAGDCGPAGLYPKATDGDNGTSIQCYAFDPAVDSCAMDHETIGSAGPVTLVWTFPSPVHVANLYSLVGPAWGISSERDVCYQFFANESGVNVPLGVHHPGWLTNPPTDDVDTFSGGPVTHSNDTVEADNVSAITAVVDWVDSCCGGWAGARFYDLEASTIAPTGPDQPVGCAGTVLSPDHVSLSCDAEAGVSTWTFRWDTSSHATFTDYPSSAGCGTVGGLPDGCEASGLTGGTTYHFRAIATNSFGDSPPTADLTFTTDPALPPSDAPTSCTATPDGFDSLRTVCDPVADADGYNIYWDTASHATSADYANVETCGSVPDCDPSGPFTVGVSYHFRMLGWNDYGNGPDGADFTGVPVDAPAAPTGCAQTGATGTSVTLTCDITTTADTYTFRNEGGAGDLNCDDVSEPTCEYTGLDPSTTYSFFAWASNVAGSSDDTADFDATTTGGGPPDTPPTSLTATTTGASTIDLIWDGANGADGYSVFLGTVDDYASGSVNGSSLAYFGHVDNVLGASVAGLDPETTYFFRVVGTNADGEGPTSDGANATTDPAPPVPPVPPPNIGDDANNALMIAVVAVAGALGIGFLVGLLHVFGDRIEGFFGGGR